MLLNDEPTTEDRLGRGPLADEIADLIATCTPPYVLGIHGDWGAGKTSFLRMLGERLPHTSRKCTVVFFEAWRHQFEAQPAVALLHSIRDQLALSRRAWDEAGKLSTVTAYTGLRLLEDLANTLSGLGSKRDGVVATARAEGERIEQSSFAVPLTSEAFRSAFQQAIAALTDDHSKLVVLIDDLDRCGDDAVVRLLEGLKLYLNADNCVFVIAADRRAVVRALQRKLFPAADAASLARAELDAAEYSDKLFQSVRSLPLAPDLRPLLSACWPDGDGAAAQIAQLQDALDFLPPNPRKLKRFMVELHGRVDGYRRTFGGAAPDISLASTIQALQTFHPAIYRVLEANPAFWAEIHAFSEEGPVLKRRHAVFAGLTVPDRIAPADPATGTALLTAEEGTTFHDPGDVSVFRAARLVRRHPTPRQQELYRLLQGREPTRRSAAPAPAPTAPVEAADLGEERPR